MIKIFETGDLHIGLKYANSPDIKNILIQSRFDCLKRCVEQAEKERCDFFVITGDLFDNNHSIRKTDVESVVQILAAFDGYVIVLPGNHDFYTGEEKVWKDFDNALASREHNITLVKAFEVLRYEVRDESISFYPAYCQAKHAKENNLDWIKNTEMDDADYHIGLAHGAIKGLSPDQKQEYFLMTEPVLKAIPVDAWLIGHMHVPYPADLEESKETSGYRIFNAGTPEQTDIANNTKGYCFVLTLNKTASKSTVSAHKYQSGDIVYLNPAIVMDPDGPALEDKLRQIADSISTRSVLRFKVAGTACPEDYKQKDALYLKVFDSLYKQGRLLTYKWDDSELCEQITKDKIRREFPEFGFAAKLLEQLEDPKEIQLAYDLVKAHQKWGGRKADDYQKR